MQINLRNLSSALILALVLAIWLPAFHADDHHVCDNTCSVHVLEQFFLATEHTPLDFSTLMFIAFIYFVRLAPLKIAPAFTFLRVRAPPITLESALTKQ